MTKRCKAVHCCTVGEKSAPSIHLTKKCISFSSTMLETFCCTHTHYAFQKHTQLFTERPSAIFETFQSKNAFSNSSKMMRNTYIPRETAEITDNSCVLLGFVKNCREWVRIHNNFFTIFYVLYMNARSAPDN